MIRLGDIGLIPIVSAVSCLNAFGVVFTELWILSGDGRHVSRPSGGHWMDPSFVSCVADPERARDVDRNAPDCAPGVSLAGTMYVETDRWLTSGESRSVHFRQLRSIVDDPFKQLGDDRRIREFVELGIGISASVPCSLGGRRGLALFFSRETANVSKLKDPDNLEFLKASADLMGAAFAIRIPRMKRARKKDLQRREAFAKTKKALSKLSK